MANTNYVIAEITANFREIQQNLSKVQQPKMITTNLERGFEVSKAASSQPLEVAMTPMMRNLLRAFGDLGEDQRLTVDDPETVGEKWLKDVQKAMLLKYFPNGKSGKYNENLSLTDRSHLDVDCWTNLKDNMRDIQPGQEKQRIDMVNTFAEPSKPLGLLKRLETDPVFQRAVMVVLDLMPPVRATTELREINIPFMTKHTNVSYPYWQNDRNLVEGENINYAELTMRDAERLKNTPWAVLNYNVSTLYGRNQRGKGRGLIATSRVLNLILNQLESEEIETYKTKCPLFAGYNDAPYLKRVLIGMVEFCEKHGLKMANYDYDSFDSTVNQDWIMLIGAMSMFKANGERSKTLALIRSILMTKTWLVDGLTHKVREIFGRIFSGEIDTNRGGGLINGTNATHKLMLMNPRHSQIMYKAQHPILVMGDDLQFMYDPDYFDANQFADLNQKDGYVLKPEKYAFGPFFLQYRLIKNGEGEYIMVYPFTRVIRSQAFKETNKGLGPAGWVMATWQQWYKLIEDPISLACAVNLWVHFDSMKMGIDMTVEQLIEMVKKEDEEARSSQSKSKQRRFKDTASRIYDGDPSKEEFFTTSESGDVQLNPSTLERIHSAIKAVYKPDFISELGFKTPAVKFD